MSYKYNCQSKANTSDLMEMYPLAMAYVPWQTWNGALDPFQGINRGTIFRELDLPFLCNPCSRREMS